MADRTSKTSLRSFRRTLALIACFAVSGILHASPVPLEVVGLFKDRAVIREAGGERLLKVGESTSQGVTLVSANAHEAVVSYLGEQHRLSLSERVASNFAQATVSQVAIPADNLGQYRIGGSINDRYVDFLVDTGASVVAFSSRTARALGIDYSTGQPGSVQTAQGTAQSYFINLERVTVAGITAHNVQAAIINGNYPTDILLGMSFLRQVSMQENDGVMTLVKKH